MVNTNPQVIVFDEDNVGNVGMLGNDQTWTGENTVITPTTDYHIATKKYVDDADDLKVDKAGDTMTDQLLFSGDGTAV